MLNKKVEEAINAQINAELWSAYLYLSMAAWCHANGNPGMGKWFEVQFQEEQDHAKIMFNYVISRAGKVDLKPIESEIKGQEARLAALRQAQDKKKPEEITQEEKDDMKNTEKAIEDEKNKKRELFANYAKDNSIVHQLIDLALLQNGMLKGAALDKFLKRSIELIK